VLVVLALSQDCHQVWVEVFVQNTAVFKNNALRVNVLCSITNTNKHRIVLVTGISSINKDKVHISYTIKLQDNNNSWFLYTGSSHGELGHHQRH